MKLLNLIETTDSLEIKLSWAVAATQLDWTCSYYDITTATWVVLEGVYTWTTNSTTAVTVCAAPAAWHIRTVKGITVYNADSQTNIVILQFNANWTIRVAIRNSLTTLASWSAEDMSFYTDISWKLDKSLYDANSILYATTDDTPVALTVGTNTVVGRVAWAITTLAVDSDLSSVSASDDTVPSAKATKAMWDLKMPLAWWTFSWAITTDTIQLTEKSIKFDAALSADGTWCWFTEAWTGWATLTFWQLCYFKAADSKWYPVDWILDWTDVWFKARLGMCVLAWASTTTEILLLGKIRVDAWTLTIWAPVYASDTAWEIVVTQPSTTNFAVRVIGYGITADELRFNPSSDYMVHI